MARQIADGCAYCSRWLHDPCFHAVMRLGAAGKAPRVCSVQCTEAYCLTTPGHDVDHWILAHPDAHGASLAGDAA